VTVPPADTAARSAVIDGIDVDAVAAAVRACSGVSGLDGGPFSGVASYLPGRKVEGIVVRDGRVIVQVRSRWAVPAPELAAVITAMLAPLTGNRPVDLVIADIDDPPGAPTPGAPPGPGLPLEQPGAPGFSPYGCE
jgi:hypothetical protein